MLPLRESFFFFGVPPCRPRNYDILRMNWAVLHHEGSLLGRIGSDASIVDSSRVRAFYNRMRSPIFEDIYCIGRGAGLFQIANH